MDMTTMMALETDWQVAPAGKGAFQCGSCLSYLSVEESDTLAQMHAVHCGECDTLVFLGNDTILSIAADAAQFMDIQNVRDSLWYHSTTRANWIEDLEASHSNTDDGVDRTKMVHVGTVDAALDRNGTRKPNEAVYMYVLRLKDAVDIAEVIKPDEDDMCPVIADDCAPQGYSTEVTRYVNMYESPGSISLLVNRKCIEVVDRIRLQ